MKTLIYLSSSPFTSLTLKEGLDLALVLGTFEQDISLCVTGDALTLLRTHQTPSSAHGKHLYKLLDGLEFYDIENVYVRQSEIGTQTGEFWEGSTALDDQAWAKMLATHTHVYRF